MFFKRLLAILALLHPLVGGQFAIPGCSPSTMTSTTTRMMTQTMTMTMSVTPSVSVSVSLSVSVSTVVMGTTFTLSNTAAAGTNGTTVTVTTTLSGAADPTPSGPARILFNRFSDGRSDFFLPFSSLPSKYAFTNATLRGPAFCLFSAPASNDPQAGRYRQLSFYYQQRASGPFDSVLAPPEFGLGPGATQDANITGFVFMSNQQTAGMAPLLRFRHRNETKHFFTTNAMAFGQLYANDTTTPWVFEAVVGQVATDCMARQ